MVSYCFYICSHILTVFVLLNVPAATTTSGLLKLSIYPLPPPSFLPPLPPFSTSSSSSSFSFLSSSSPFLPSSSFLLLFLRVTETTPTWPSWTACPTRCPIRCILRSTRWWSSWFTSWSLWPSSRSTTTTSPARSSRAPTTCRASSANTPRDRWAVNERMDELLSL